jgi:inner membrane transporter RhtA
MGDLAFVVRLPGAGRRSSLPPISRLGSRLLGPASIVAACVSLQAAAALATTVFAAFGATGTSALRFLAGAAVLALLARPRLRGRSRRSWLNVCAFGASMAAANFCLFEAIARTSLGTAVTLQFLGPLALALVAARRRLDLCCAIAGAAGVVLLTGGPSAASLAGVALGLGAAASVAVSIAAGERVARETDGLEGLALAVGAAALFTAPVGVGAALGNLDLGALALVAGLGVLGVAIPYALFMGALRRVGSRTYSVLLSLDPAVAVLVGVVLLSQAPGHAELVGVALVVCASAIAVSTRPGYG